MDEQVDCGQLLLDSRGKWPSITPTSPVSCPLHLTLANTWCPPLVFCHWHRWDRWEGESTVVWENRLSCSWSSGLLPLFICLRSGVWGLGPGHSDLLAPGAAGLCVHYPSPRALPVSPTPSCTNCSCH